MSSEKVGALFENAGLGYGLGVGYQASQAKLAEAMQGKDETAIQQAQANLQKTQLEIDNFGKSKTDTALAGITTLKSALASGSIDQTAYDNLSAEL